MRFLDDIGAQAANTNMHFLVVELTLANYATSPYVFYPEKAVVMMDEENDYDRALVSLIKLPNSIIEESKIQSVEEVNIYKCHMTMGQIEGGVIQDELIPPNGTYKGSLVYQIPLGEGSYIFKYVDSMNEIMIPFKKPSGSNHA
jgi:hypothetical protein